MRKDISKVLCETYKVGRKHVKQIRHTRSLNEVFNEVGGKVGMQKYHCIGGSDIKSFGENLNPLYRFIEQQLGRPWSKVYSEICEVCKKTGAVQNHIFLHLYDVIFPPEKVEIIDGVPYEKPSRSYGSNEITRTGNWWGSFYVDPRDGIIKTGRRVKSYSAQERENKKRRAREELKVKRVISPYLEYHKIFNVWYKYELKDIPKPVLKLTPPTAAYASVWQDLSEDKKKEVGVLKLVPVGYTDVFKSTWYNSAGKVLEGYDPLPSKETAPGGLWEYLWRKNPVKPTRYYSARFQASKAEIRKFKLN